jgi:chemotaxis family two-component system response regulator Rcp1
MKIRIGWIVAGFTFAMILLVAAGWLSVRAALQSTEDVLPHRLNVVSDGEQAMTFLERKQPFEQAPRPHLILLDLNLPKLNGREVLARIRKDPSLRGIPVVILTTLNAESDILASYDLQANGFVIKPASYEQFMHAIKTIERYWLELVKLRGVPVHE